MSKSHNEFNLQKCSLLTDPCCPYLTTTPDGFTSCSCCGTGIVEVVCPVCMRAAEPHALQQATPAKSACLERLKGWFDKTKDDSWYYRLQSQLHGCDKQYCDLVVWANKNLLIKRYFRNTPFFEAQRLEEEAKKELPGVLKKWIADDSSPRPPVVCPAATVTGRRMGLWCTVKTCSVR
ncbi:uncharacterized protein LOC135096308 [Scylla paramamosain]|uniref:uncharacterized protein LOC135096308 n=1 Tax=Scylla paramamosain TaxID=85552 RepID=UPI003083A2F5